MNWISNRWNYWHNSCLSIQPCQITCLTCPIHQKGNWCGVRVTTLSALLILFQLHSFNYLHTVLIWPGWILATQNYNGIEKHHLTGYTINASQLNSETIFAPGIISMNKLFCIQWVLNKCLLSQTQCFLNVSATLKYNRM